MSKPIKSRPITLTPDEIRAILAGRLTQVLRVVSLSDPSQTYAVHDDDGWPCSADEAGDWHRDRCPWGVVGDRLTWQCDRCQDSSTPGTLIGDPECRYCHGSGRVREHDSEYSDGLMDCEHCIRTECPDCIGASRITLEITGVRVERLQDTGEWVWLLDVKRVGPTS